MFFVFTVTLTMFNDSFFLSRSRRKYFSLSLFFHPNSILSIDRSIDRRTSQKEKQVADQNKCSRAEKEKKWSLQRNVDGDDQRNRCRAWPFDAVSSSFLRNNRPVLSIRLCFLRRRRSSSIDVILSLSFVRSFVQRNENENSLCESFLRRRGNSFLGIVSSRTDSIGSIGFDQQSPHGALLLRSKSSDNNEYRVFPESSAASWYHLNASPVEKWRPGSDDDQNGKVARATWKFIFNKERRKLHVD